MFTSHSVLRRAMVFAAFVFAVGNMAIATADGLTSFGTGGYAGGIRSREVTIRMGMA
jgi:hypothetical protein